MIIQHYKHNIKRYRYVHNALQIDASSKVLLKYLFRIQQKCLVTAILDECLLFFEQQTWMQVKTKTQAPPMEILRQAGTLAHPRSPTCLYTRDRLYRCVCSRVRVRISVIKDRYLELILYKHFQHILYLCVSRPFKHCKDSQMQLSTSSSSCCSSSSVVPNSITWLLCNR